MDRRNLPAFGGWNPFKELARIESELNRLFGDVIPAAKEVAEVQVWAPRVDVYEKDDKIIVEAEIPGAKKEDIEVKIKENNVIIKGEVKKDEEKKEDNFYRRERFYGKFERVIPLPVEVKAEEAKAKIEDGILKLEIPKVQAEKEIKVELQ